ncbi:hypothetical protein H4Q26_005837 [Puccinia striiformis f. sp. tritici PST-130]|nr:hypothetical protein H4Q26_005837 [Puccinia striiformis f. sp. tritici PST-130]
MPVSVDDPEAFVCKHFIDDGIPIKSFTSYSWKITEYSKQPKRVKSGSFTGGDYKWYVAGTTVRTSWLPMHIPHGPTIRQTLRLVSMTLHPRQVEEGGNDRVSIYLHVKVQTVASRLAYIRYRFTDDQGYGFPEFAKLKDLTSPHGSRTKPLIENDETRVTAFVQVLEDETGVLWRDFVKCVRQFTI